MAGAQACWRCHAPVAGPAPPGYYPPYAAQPVRRMSCWVWGFLLACFLCAGGGLGGYWLYRKANNPEAGIEQQLNRPIQTDEERRLQEALKGAPRGAETSEFRNVRAGMGRQEVEDKLGKPDRVEKGYIITDESQALSRELWVYHDGWVMFRYDLVVQSGLKPEPILNKQSIPVPGAGQ
jgi:hypothetical protein